MGILQKIKALWAARKVVKQVGEIKRGWKTLGFWVTLLGSLVGAGATIQGLLPATAGVCVIAGLTAAYNILRGVQKSQEAGVREWWKTSENWLAMLGFIQTALLSVQQGGVNPEWMAGALAVLGGAVVAARDLSHKQPT